MIVIAFDHKRELIWTCTSYAQYDDASSLQMWQWALIKTNEPMCRLVMWNYSHIYVSRNAIDHKANCSHWNSNPLLRSCNYNVRWCSSTDVCQCSANRMHLTTICCWINVLVCSMLINIFMFVPPSALNGVCSFLLFFFFLHHKYIVKEK